MNIHDATEIAYRNGYAEGRRACEAEIAQLSEKCQRLQRERDAAVADLKKAMPCRACKHLVDLEYCKTCYLENHWEWRGIDETD